MSFVHAHGFTINKSTFNDIQGDYHYNATTPGERGIAKLFEASCPDASHDSQARYPPPQCLPGTRTDLLREILEWIERSNKKVLWMFGPAGAGKSAIAQTIAEICAKSNLLAVSFFFFYGAPDRSTVERLVLSIAYQLAIRMPEKRTQLGKIIEADPSILRKPLAVQMQTLIIPLFIAAPPNSIHADILPSHPQPQQPHIVIIDGLDECKGDDNQRDVIRHMENLANKNGVPLRFMIISRPEPQIEESFGYIRRTFHWISLSGKHRDSQASDDIHTYLRHGFDQIYQKRHHDIFTEHYWPTDNIMSVLVLKATVMRYIGDDDFHPEERLREVLDTPPGLTPFAELDHLYHRILNASPDLKCLRQVLSFASFWDVGVRDLELILRLPQGRVRTAVRRTRSILHNTDISISLLFHASFRDFLHNPERAGKFFIDVRGAQAFIAQKLLELLRLGVMTHHSDSVLPVTSASRGCRDRNFRYTLIKNF